MSNGADVKALEALALRLREDAGNGINLNINTMISIADIIEQAIGAPLMWPVRSAGCEAAAAYYPGAPDLRHGFNAGVKWAVENYQPSVPPSRRYG